MPGNEQRSIVIVVLGELGILQCREHQPRHKGLGTPRDHPTSPALPRDTTS